MQVESEFDEEVVHIEAQFSLSFSVLVEYRDQVGSSFVELLHVLLDVHLFDEFQILGWLGELADIDLEGRTQRFSEVVEFCLKFEFFKEETINLVKRGFFRELINVVPHNLFQLLQSDVVDIEFKQNFSSALAVVEVLT